MELWRLVLEGVCTITELKTSMTLDDVLRANAILDMKDAMQEHMNSKIK